jgi:hypothetical protein
MQILVISDSHGEDAHIKGLLEAYANRVQAVLHLGDHDRDLLRLAQQTHLPLYAVAGNCDGGSHTPREQTLEFGKLRIFMAHGHKYNLNAGVERLVYRARELGVQACLFGHTHKSVTFTQHDIFFMNPGSVTEPRGYTKPGYGLLTLCEASGKITGEIIDL